MFGPWVDVTSGFVPDSPKRGRATFKARKGIKIRRFNQIQFFFRRLTSTNKYIYTSQKFSG